MMASLLILLWSVLAVPVAPVKWSFQAVPQANGEVLVQCTATLEEGWHVYALTLPSDQGPIATAIRLKPSEAYEPLGDMQEPTPVETYDQNFGMVVRYHDGTPIFTQRIRPRKEGPVVVEGEVEYMLCNDKTCLPPVTVPFSLTISPETKP
jgi:DsbC/DsbD-like thiol-disulfide interchange protein